MSANKGVKIISLPKIVQPKNVLSKITSDVIANNISVKEVLKNSNMNFVFVAAPIDKTANNASVICRRFYATILLYEFGVIGTPSKTYILISGYDKNILIRLTVDEIKQCLFPEK